MSNETNILDLIKNNKINEIKHYIDFNTFDYSNLHYNFQAIYSQQKLSFEMIEYFINELKFKINDLIVSYAIKYEQIDVITLILSKNKFIFSDSNLQLAVKSNNSNLLQLFIYYDLFDDYIELDYLLLWAVQYNCVNSLYTLIKANACDLDFNNNTLIHRALLSKNLEIVKILIKEEQIKNSLMTKQQDLYGKINVFLSQYKIESF